MSKGYVILVIALWCAPVLAFALPRLAASLERLRRAGGEGTAFVLLIIAACVYAVPSAASKGGTNEPPPVESPYVPSGRIMLYVEDASGRLVPLGADIREVAP